MQDELYDRINAVLDEKVRPSLKQHGGDVEIVEVADGVLKVRMLGKCGNCPSASLTLESLVESEVVASIAEVEKVVLVTGVSDETWEMARAILARRKKEAARGGAGGKK